MNDLTAQSLAYLKEHWHIGMTGTSDAAEFLEINPNTLKTRLARGQALVLRDPRGERRSVLTFTGYHLVYNLLSDRLLRYGFPVEHDETTSSMLPHVYAEWALNNVLSPPHHFDAIVRFSRDRDGEIMHLPFENGVKDDWTHDAALIVPIGELVRHLAFSVHLRAFPAIYWEAEEKARRER